MRRLIGDIYAIHLSDGRVGFMQHIANDSSQLGSHIIRVFEIIQSQCLSPDLEAIVQSGVKFYAHVLLKAGETLGVWEKIGRVKKVTTSIPLWCQCNEADFSVPVSKNWVAWQTNGPRVPAVPNSRNFIEAELGDVFSPLKIRTRLTDGKYGGVYPGKPVLAAEN